MKSGFFAFGTTTRTLANMKTIYFVRHGQSEGNVSPVYQTMSSPLTKEGKQQAQFIGERCSQLPIEAIISSTQLRAKETAALIAEKTGHTVEFSDLFRERRKPTELNGKLFDDPEAKQLNEAWWQSLIAAGPRAGDGENFQDINGRADSALEYLIGRPEDHILVVTHGFYMRYIVAKAIFGDKLTGELFADFAPSLVMENTGITILRHGTPSVLHAWGKAARWELWVWNDHAHLG